MREELLGRRLRLREPVADLLHRGIGVARGLISPVGARRVEGRLIAGALQERLGGLDQVLARAPARGQLAERPHRQDGLHLRVRRDAELAFPPVAGGARRQIGRIDGIAVGILQPALRRRPGEVRGGAEVGKEGPARLVASAPRILQLRHRLARARIVVARPVLKVAQRQPLRDQGGDEEDHSLV